MKNAEKKELARGLFLKSSLNRKQIADQVRVTEKTLRNWIEKEDWETLKDSMMITRPQLLQDAMAQLKAINKKIREELNNVPTKELSDAKGVIRKEIEIFSNQPLHRYIEVFEEYIDWLAKNDPDKLSEFAQSSQAFINDLSKIK